MLITTEIEYEASPIDIAEEFLDMSIEEQADTLYIIATKIDDVVNLNKCIESLGYRDRIIKFLKEVT